MNRIIATRNYSNQVSVAEIAIAISIVALVIAACEGKPEPAPPANPAGELFKEAESFAAEGKYDEAIGKWQEVESKWPKSEEAKKVPSAVGHALAENAVKLFKQEEFKAAGDAYLKLLAATAGGAEEWVATDAAGLGLAAKYAKNAEGSPTQASFEAMFAVHGAPEVPPGLAKLAASWLCKEHKNFPAYPKCAQVDSDVAGLAIADARARLEDAESACKELERLVPICIGDVAEMITALSNSDAKVKLSEGVNELESRLLAEAEGQAKGLGSEMDSIVKKCRSAEKKRAGLEKTMFDLAVKNKMNQAMKYVGPHDKLVEQNNGRADRLDEMAKDVKSKEWPEDFKSSLSEELSAARAECRIH